MSRGKIDYFSLWHVDPSAANSDASFIYLKKLLIKAAQFFLLPPSKELKLAHKMSFKAAIRSLSEQLHLGIKELPAGQINSSDFPLLARHKVSNQLVLLLPHGPTGFIVINDTLQHNFIHREDIYKHLSDVLLVFKKSSAKDTTTTIASIGKTLTTPWLIGSILLLKALFFVSSFFWLSKLLLAESHNIAGFFLAILISGGIFYATERVLFYSGSKHYNLFALLSFHHIYKRLSLLTKEQLSIVSFSVLSSLKRAITRDAFNFFMQRTDSLFYLSIMLLNLVFVWWHEALFSYVLLALMIAIIILKSSAEKKLLAWQQNIDHARAQQELMLSALETSFSLLASLRSLEGIVEKINEQTKTLRSYAKKHTYYVIILAGAYIAVPLFFMVLSAPFLYVAKNNYSLSNRLLFFFHLISFSLCCLEIIRTKWQNTALSLSTTSKIAKLPEALYRGTLLPLPLSGQIELTNLSFNYEESSSVVIKNANALIEAGTCYQIRGESGAGKSTLMALLSAQLVPSSGQVYFDGQDARSLDHDALHSYFGVVGQESKLLLGSVYDNIVCGRAYQKKSLEKLLLSHEIFDVILDLPMGLQSYVFTERSNLTHLQKATILLARAMLHEPKILFLDEIFNGLDQKEQSLLISFLGQLSITRLIIAHHDLAIPDSKIIYIKSAELKIS